MSCPARLDFGIDDRFMKGFIMDANRIGLAFHPLDAVHFRPMQGPQAARCVRDHDDGWHWDGAGTWWTA